MLGEKLKQAVNQSRLTAEEAAKGLGVSVSNLYVLYKKDSFSLDYVRKASNMLGMPVSYFLENELDTAPTNSNGKGSGDIVLGEIIKELRLLREQLQVKDQQIAGLQRTVDVLVGKSEGVINEPLSIGQVSFKQTFDSYRSSVVKQFPQIAIPEPVAKVVAPR